MFRRWKFVVAALLAGHALAASAVTGMKFISTPGDYIGQGQTQTFKSPGSTITTSATPGQVTVSVSDSGNGWLLRFAAPSGNALAVGGYPDAARYPFNSPLGAGLDVSGDGRGCNTLKGWFKVLEYELNPSGVVARLAIDFVQNCEVTGPPLYGSVRVNSSLPLVVPDLQAIAGADFAVIAGQPATLNGTQSFSRRQGALTYQWTQIDGPVVALSNATSATPGFTATDPGPNGGTLHFRLDVMTGARRSASDDVVVVVQSATAPRTQLSFSGDPGDYITGGRSYAYDPYNALIGFTRNFGDGITATVNGAAYWTLDAAPPVGSPLTTGSYLNAQRYPFQATGSPGLSLSGDGRGCNTVTGQFTVHQVQFDSSGNPLMLDLTFEQHCEGGAPAARGQALLNAVPHQTVATQLRAARQRYGARQ
jgi:hypothetical protein